MYSKGIVRDTVVHVYFILQISSGAFVVFCFCIFFFLFFFFFFGGGGRGRVYNNLNASCADVKGAVVALVSYEPYY